MLFLKSVAFPNKPSISVSISKEDIGQKLQYKTFQFFMSCSPPIHIYSYSIFLLDKQTTVQQHSLQQSILFECFFQNVESKQKKKKRNTVFGLLHACDQTLLFPPVKPLCCDTTHVNVTNVAVELCFFLNVMYVEKVMFCFFFFLF